MSQTHDPEASVWANRCVTSAKLGIQVLNHPGVARHAAWFAPAHDAPRLGAHACMGPLLDLLRNSDF